MTPKNNRADLTGKRFGRLLIISRTDNIPHPTKHNLGGWDVAWVCKCDCGKEIVTRSSSLMSGRSKSCGCLRSDIVRESNRNRTRDKCWNYGKDRNESCARLIMSRYKYGAKYRDLDFNLTYEQFFKLATSSCYYCGSPPANIGTNPKFPEEHFIYNGIDRLDNTKGYNKDNCVPSCHQCNWGKNKCSVEDFISWVDKVYKYIHGKNIA